MTAYYSYECDHEWRYIETVARYRCRLCKTWLQEDTDTEPTVLFLTPVSLNQLGPFPAYNGSPCDACNCQDVIAFGRRRLPNEYPCLDSGNTRQFMTPEERTKLVITNLKQTT